MSEQHTPHPIDNEVTQSIYDFIEDHIQTQAVAPSQREIAENCYISKGNVIRHLDRLEKLGWITREEGKARSIRLLVE